MKVITITIVLNRDVKNKKQRSLYLKKYFINFLFILKGIHTQWSLEKYEKKLRKKIGRESERMDCMCLTGPSALLEERGMGTDL